MYIEYNTFKLPVQTTSPESQAHHHFHPTPSDIEGPFYMAGAPEIASGVIGSPEIIGDAVLLVSGRVLDTNGVPVVGAILDIWQADGNGVYDNVGYKLRGKIKTNMNGEYQFKTIVPGDYQIAANPPDFRCAHIHVKVSAHGFKLLTTQLYFQGDKYNQTDHWFDKRRVVQLPIGKFDFIIGKS